MFGPTFQFRYVAVPDGEVHGFDAFRFLTANIIRFDVCLTKRSCSDTFRSGGFRSGGFQGPGVQSRARFGVANRRDRKPSGSQKLAWRLLKI